jgi:hypothetical protein
MEALPRHVLERELASARAAVTALQGELAAARSAAADAAARADDAWGMVLAPSAAGVSGRQTPAGGESSLVHALEAARAEAEAQRARADRLDAALSAQRGAGSEALAAQRRVAAAEADAAAATDGAAVLHFVAAAELRRCRAAAAAEHAALNAELKRAREQLAAAAKGGGGADPAVVEQLWSVVQQQDEALTELMAQLAAQEARGGDANVRRTNVSRAASAQQEASTSQLPPPSPRQSTQLPRGLPPLRAAWETAPPRVV